ncbi:PEP-utilizing enzyme [Nocardia fluminea]|uniref:PEP-utilizing enzyme n=1 Tax=Nocardia fluminea TaxID=134984 RepID=UPI0033D9076C
MTSAVAPHGLLHARSDNDTFWSTTNVGEAFPGILTPLGWSLCGPSVELGIRNCYARVGALPRSEVRIPDRVEDRLISVFHGRGALNVNFFCRMGAHLPGTAPDAIARQFLGELPPGIPTGKSRRRLPIVAVKTAYTQATIRRDVLRRTADVLPWWRDQTAAADALDLPDARRVLAEAHLRFREMIRVQAAGLFVAVQSVYDRFLALTDRADLAPDHIAALVAGHGDHAESGMITDLWALGRDQITLRDFLDVHGYHGPLEGELSARVWREDPAPVLRLVEHYRSLDDSADPVVAALARTQARRDAERALVRALPMRDRVHARAVLAATAARMPLRGVAKASFLQAFDVARAAARRMGTLMHEQRILADPDDIFFLTIDELCTAMPRGITDLVDTRREQHREYTTFTLPTHWRGTPPQVPIAPVKPAAPVTTLCGIGASAGVVEARVRVLDDPGFADFAEPGEILVCRSTDPSWASVLFLSAALVVDVGGLLSHAAVVAREISIPCVVGTGNGTRMLQTGDRVRVDGTAGTVEILFRASELTSEAAHP